MKPLFYLIKRIFAQAEIVKKKQISLSAMVMVNADSSWSNMISMIGSDGQSAGYLLYLLVMGGILLIIAVLIYNWWEEKRFNEQVSKSFSEIDDDALLDENKQAFLDKFAATTGFLNDTPDINQLPDDDKHAFDDKQSIDEVYSELLETIAKRTSAKDLLDENGHITIDHDTIDNTVPERSEYDVASADVDESHSVYIPDVVELDVDDINSDGNVAKHIDDNDPTLRKKESIRNIINEAFRAKYNPNYQKVVDAEIAPDDESHLGDDHSARDEAPDANIEPEDSQVNTTIRFDDIEVPNIDEINSDDALEDLLGDAELNQSIQPEISVAESAQVDTAEIPNEIVQNEAAQNEANEDGYDEAFNRQEELSVNLSQVGEDGNDELLDIKFPEEALESSINAFDSEPPSETPVNDASQEIAETNSEIAGQADSQGVEVLSMPAELNPQMDIVGELVIANVSPASNILETFGRLENDYDKPTFVFAQSSNNKWVMLNNASDEALTYHFDKNKPIKIVAGMQLADRSGPASKNTIQRFKNALEANAKEMGYKAQWPDAQDPVEKASSLDAFCIDVDKTMFFHILNDGTPFTGIKLRGLVEAQGMELTNDGSFKYFASAEAMQMKKPDFMLFNRDNHRFTHEMLRTSVIKAVTFQLDIPQIGADGKSLERMIEIAQHLKNNLNATLVDDNNRPLTDIQMVKIREQIKSIHATMQLRGIKPGSNHAFRLFS